ncbi:hypothetical protein LWI28_024695 [Acer negundo]|uniref:Reverse transcriptase domain-containing protein n=1 Tax=Acer negundo TaxID=4023 RepID=A0AAD5IH19_ACENE|nr:hypothetical protein LWI28_024695 [Acer negundo]
MECRGIVEASWQTPDLPSEVGSVLNKIEECGRRLKSWNMKKRGELRADLRRKREAVIAASKGNGRLNWRTMRGLENQLDEVLETEERYWKQRAKVEWLKGGDRNTRFFHSKASARKARNRIQGLMDGNGVWRDSRTDIESITSQYFTDIFTSSNPSEVDLNYILDDVVPKLSQSKSSFLDMKFTGDEVKKAIFDMSPTKAPGCDGLPAVFFQQYWESIGTSVVNACLCVLNNGASVEGMNKTVIALIPKVQSPVRVTDFRPISLCNVIYKAVAKAMTNRLRLVLGEVISGTQCAFIPGRLISDNTIVGFECLHRLKRRKRKHGSMAIKLDMSKAYDRVEWSFLSGMMRKLGFSEKWVELVMRCVSSVSYSMCINGDVCGNIRPSRGLRQGDPLSPFLFLFCAEGLTSLLDKAQENGGISGFKCSTGGPIISHLFFADDSLIFAKANDHNCNTIKNILERYAKASGQVINYDKSALCTSPSCPVAEGERLASLIGIKLVACHEKYLGLPCFTGRNKRKLFANIADRVWGRIKGWGEKLLSTGGKEILIKAVIQAIPSYAMSIFRLPKGLVAEIHRMCARFWWGSKENHKKIHWCTWKRLCKTKSDGGLGFRDIDISNRANLAKQCWRLLKNPDSLAAKVLKGCYYKDGGFLEAGKCGSGSFVWNSLMWGKALLVEGVRWRVGNGKSIKIYKDKWIPRHSTFKIVSSPKLDTEATVDQLFTPSGEWNVNLIKVSFLPVEANAILSIPIGRSLMEDTTLWHYEGNGVYSVKSGYWLGNHIDDRSSSSSSANINSWWPFFWKLNIPLKVKIMIWKYCFDWIPTKANIARRGIQTSNICDACKSSPETTLHALWNCKRLKNIKSEWNTKKRAITGQFSDLLDLLQAK